MTSAVGQIECGLLVIGSGMAGSAAALFAAQNEIDTVQVGMTGELNFASGVLDYMGVHPIETGRVWSDPHQAIEALIKDLPHHPYANIKRADRSRAWDQFLTFLNTSGLAYSVKPQHNVQIPTPVGTLKTTYAVPLSMAGGIEALDTSAPCLIVDFKGLKGFSGRQMVETLKHRWPRLRTQRLCFPKTGGERYAEHLAQSLHLPETLSQLARAIHPHIDKALYVGLPAILGISRSQAVFESLQDQLGVTVFEIPTMPPSVMGLRLRTVFEQHLPKYGVRSYCQHKVLGARIQPDGNFRCEIGADEVTSVVHSKGIVLATGRFFGGGLLADHRRISEPLFNLPVYQPENRSAWHQKSFLDVKGHAINRSGLDTDHQFRPLAANGEPFHPNLFAVGSILAHQDWMRMKCGSGLAITSAFGAVKAFKKSP